MKTTIFKIMTEVEWAKARADGVFDGSAGAVMLSLFDGRDIDKDELQELRDRIDRKLRDPS